MQKSNKKNNQSYATVLRSEKTDFLTALVNNQKMTSDGKEWLVAALDPFHDYNHQIAGYPDADVSQTVVSCYTYEASIKCPTFVTTGTWDAHIFTLPLASSFDAGAVYNESTDWGRMKDPAPSVVRPLGPLNWSSNATGGLLGPAIPISNNEVCGILPVNGVEDISSGCSRMIGMGFEVHNTTADIYKQGAVTTYRMPQCGNQNQIMFVNNAETSWGTVTGKRFRSPPTNIGQVNLLKGTRTWEARDGCYATCFQNTVTNPLLQVSAEHTLFDPYPDPGQTAIVVGTPLIPGLPAANATTYNPSACQTAPYDTTGAFFTGLSLQTTLTVKLRVYVERAPTFSESQLAVLASPSAGYDLVALQMYSAVINMLPPAVHVGENAAGDWWRAVLSVLKHVAAPLGIALNPVIPGAALVGTTVSRMAGQINPSKSVSRQVAKQEIDARPVSRRVRIIDQKSSSKPEPNKKRR